jgi:predicted RNA-binding protein with PUA-like domain
MTSAPSSSSRWLVKSEPEAYSYEQLVKDRVTSWTGVRNYTARNNLRAMQKGDLALFYHSVGPKEIVGIARVSKAAFPDPTVPPEEAKLGWLAVELAPHVAFEDPVSLAVIKADPRLADMLLVKQSRLSVTPVTEAEWDVVLSLAGG